MRPSSFQRWLFEGINLTLVLTFMIPLSILMARFFGFPAQWMPWLLCLTALGFLAGRLTMHANASVAQVACFGTAALAAVLCAVILHWFGGGFGTHMLGSVTYTGVTAIGTLAFFFCARKAGYTVYAPMSLVGILLHLLALIVLYTSDASAQLKGISSWTAIIFFLLSLYAFNARGLRKSVYTSESTSTARLPRGIQMSSFLLVTAFILLAALLSLAAPVIPFLGSVLGYCIRWVLHAFSWLISIFDHTDPLVSTQDVVYGSPMEDIKLPFDMDPKGEAAWVTDLVSAFAMLVVAVLGIVLLVWWYRKFLKGMKFMQKFLGKMQDLFNPEQVEDYVDETESLFSWREAFNSATEGLRSTMRKITERPQKFDDFRDDRLKIRFVYQQLLKRMQKDSSGIHSQYETPNELQQRLPDDADRFIAAYNDVRYADASPDADALAKAKALLDQK